MLDNILNPFNFSFLQSFAGQFVSIVAFTTLAILVHWFIVWRFPDKVVTPELFSTDSNQNQNQNQNQIQSNSSSSSSSATVNAAVNAVSDIEQMTSQTDVSFPVGLYKSGVYDSASNATSRLVAFLCDAAGMNSRDDMNQVLFFHHSGLQGDIAKIVSSRHPGVTLCGIQNLKKTFADVDACLIFNSIQAVPNKSLFFRKCFESLLPGSRLSCVEYVRSSDPSLVSNRDLLAESNYLLSRGTLETLEGLRSLMERAGFEVHVSMDMSLEHGFDVAPNWITTESELENILLNYNGSNNDSNHPVTSEYRIQQNVINAAANSGLIYLARFLAVKPKNAHSFNSSNNSSVSVHGNTKRSIHPHPIEVGPAKNIHLRRLQGSVHNTGIVAMDIWFPKRYVSQTELEAYDNVSAGKYTIGLGQTNMGFCDDVEDINSICLTVVKNLMSKFNISYQDVGRLEVGTETLIDKSKSVKTVIMQLFSEHGNTNMEGVTNVNACYGGTAALFNSVTWVESDLWDGRYALVVSADIAAYAKGPARPTGGAGAVAMLIYRNAPIVIEKGYSYSHFEHVYDFYKPDPSVEYPTVDGALSMACYLRAVDRCYNGLCENILAAEGAKYDCSTGDYFCFHSPYNKLVKKGFARLLYNDYIKDVSNPLFEGVPIQLSKLTVEESVTSRELETEMMARSKKLYEEKVAPSETISRQVGNMYTASLYASIVSLLCNEKSKKLEGKRIFCFSYGSGLAASMFPLVVRGSIDYITDNIKLEERLNARVLQPPQVLEESMKFREALHGKSNYVPLGDPTAVEEGSYFLTGIDKSFRRTYSCTSLHEPNKTNPQSQKDF